MRDHIEQHIYVNADINTVWKTLTTKEGILGWFGDEAEIDLRPGGEARFGWTEYDSSSHAVIETVDEPVRFSFRWAATGTANVRTGHSTLVEFSLVADANGTTVTMRESGFASLPDDIAADDLARNTSGWTAELEDLRVLLEGTAVA